MNGESSMSWQPGGRALLPELLGREWDLLVIGGGISGAGVLLEAARRGLRALLVERRDFAWGTSSRSSKLVHGGLRYLKQGRLHLTAESVREREMLLRCAPGLVEPQGFVFASHARKGRRTMLAGLALYELLARRRRRHWADSHEVLMLAPELHRDGLLGGFTYGDARTDDARLVLRVLQEARAAGGAAFNYVGAHSLVRKEGRVAGAIVECALDGSLHEVRARVVVDATGAWSGALHGRGPRLRPLRGSHLLLPAWRLPLAQAVGLLHPRDGRPVFAYPWEGATLVGTTDLDHDPQALAAQREPGITRPELDYLMEALRAAFPRLGLHEREILSTYAGVRPVIAGQAGAAPSTEGREHAVWSEDGLVAIAGGKLTTFRAIALDALRLARRQLPGWNDPLDARPAFLPAPGLPSEAQGLARRLHGRYGPAAPALQERAQAGELDIIPGTETAWGELRWAARMEAVQRLDDLLLRRTRVGLLLRGGAEGILDRVRAICQPELAWDDARWAREQDDYLALWRAHYSLPADASA